MKPASTALRGRAAAAVVERQAKAQASAVDEARMQEDLNAGPGRNQEVSYLL